MKNEEYNSNTPANNYKNDIYILCPNFSFSFYCFIKTIKITFYSRNLIDQISRASTSIGANTIEAKYSGSTKELSHKLSIALKEAKETEYWLRFLKNDYPEKIDTLLKFEKDLNLVISILHSCVYKLRKKSASKYS